VVGGAEIYRIALPLAIKLYLTRVLGQIEGDTYLPEVDFSLWEKVTEESVPQGERDSHRTLFQEFHRKKG